MKLQRNDLPQDSSLKSVRLAGGVAVYKHVVSIPELIPQTPIAGEGIVGEAWSVHERCVPCTH